MIKVSLNDFMNALAIQKPEKPIKLFLGDKNQGRVEIMVLFNNSGYYITDKIQKIDYAEHNKLLFNFHIRSSMYKDGENWRLFIRCMHERFNLDEYPEVLI